MSSPLVNHKPYEPQTPGLERLIPGQAQLLRNGKKRPRAVKPDNLSARKIADIPQEQTHERTLDLLLPRPLQARQGARWLRFVAADFVLVATNWLLAGALLVPLRKLFPHVRSFAFAAGAPRFLLALAVLHASLITLLG